MSANTVTRDREPASSHSPTRREAILRRLFDSNIVGIILADLDGNITAANDLFLDLVGYRRQDLPLRWDEITPPEWAEQDRAKVREVLETGAGRPWEKEYLRRDGGRVLVMVGGALVERSTGLCVAIVLDISERKRDEMRLAEYRDRLRDLNAQLAWTEERHDRRIAGVIHDEVGQILATARIKVCDLRDSESSAERVPRLEEVLELVERAIEATRSLTFELSPPVLHDLGLAAALEALGERTAERHGLRFVFEIGQGWSPPAADDGIVLYRVVRELLRNVVQHARASRVRMALDRIRSGVRIAIEDDGVGLDAVDGHKTDGFGLFQVRERLARLCGDLEIDSAPGCGTRVVLTVPLTKPKERRRTARR